jgi:hypothetical protein
MKSIVRSTGVDGNMIGSQPLKKYRIVVEPFITVISKGHPTLINFANICSYIVILCIPWSSK